MKCKSLQNKRKPHPTAYNLHEISLQLSILMIILRIDDVPNRVEL
jgi:hypothetical protein